MEPSSLITTLAQAQPASGGGGLGIFLPLILFMGAMWFLMIAPQRKRQKQHAQMLESLKPGDQVITAGGIYGTIQQVRGDRFVIKIAESTRIEITKGSVQAKDAGESTSVADKK